MLSWCSSCNRSRAAEVQIVVLFPQFTLCGQDNDVLPYLAGGENKNVSQLLAAMTVMWFQNSRNAGESSIISVDSTLNVSVKSCATPKKNVWHQALGTQCGICHQCCITQAIKQPEQMGAVYVMLYCTLEWNPLFQQSLTPEFWSIWDCTMKQLSHILRSKIFI